MELDHLGNIDSTEVLIIDSTEVLAFISLFYQLSIHLSLYLPINHFSIHPSISWPNPVIKWVIRFLEDSRVFYLTSFPKPKGKSTDTVKTGSKTSFMSFWRYSICSELVTSWHLGQGIIQYQLRLPVLSLKFGQVWVS